MFGRKRPIPDMQSKNPNARNFAERTAVNTPLQGTAADLIKLAMIRIHEHLRGMQTKMLLQVHDELVFEAPPEEVEAVRAMVKSEMESVERLDVPLVVASAWETTGAMQNRILACLLMTMTLVAQKRTVKRRGGEAGACIGAVDRHAQRLPDQRQGQAPTGVPERPST